MILLVSRSQRRRDQQPYPRDSELRHVERQVPVLGEDDGLVVLAGVGLSGA
jgi:hypothetical protein